MLRMVQSFRRHSVEKRTAGQPGLTVLRMGYLHKTKWLLSIHCFVEKKKAYFLQVQVVAFRENRLELPESWYGYDSDRPVQRLVNRAEKI